MSSVVISGDTSGSVTLQAPAVSGTTVLTLPATSGTVITTASGTASSATTATTATNLAGGSNGTIPYQSAAGTTQMLAVGTSGQLLQTNGVGAPTWATVSAGFTLGTPVATTSGTSIDFTGIPAGVKQIIISFASVSTSGTGRKYIKIGDAGGIETTGYKSCSSRIIATVTATNSVTDGFVIHSATASHQLCGSVTLTLENSSTNQWAASGNLSDESDIAAFALSGIKPLSGVLDRVRITTVSGTDTFVTGEVNIAYM